MPTPLFDLPTLLALRIGVDALIAIAFWALMRRYPAIGGPGWWSVSALVSIVGSAGLWLRGSAPEFFTVSMANSALTASALLAWMGLRSYLHLPRPPGWIALALGILLAWQTVFLLVWDLPVLRQTFFALTSIAIIVLSMRDIVLSDPQRRVPELQALKWLSVLEASALASFLVATPVLKVPLDVAASVALFFFLLARLLRVVLYGSLVTYRLRQEGDRARKDLQSREVELRTLVENLSAGVIVLRPDRTVVTINTAAREFLGWNEETARTAMIEPMARDWRLMREDGQWMVRHEVPFERVLASGQPMKSVVMGVKAGADKQVRWALCNAFPENDVLGGLRHVVFTFVDVTSLKEAQDQHRVLEQQLSQSQKMEALGTLAGGVAHDFNNILAAILGNADLARQDLEPGSLARESLHEISTAARRGRELVRQILAFSRQQPLARTSLDLGHTVGETCRLLRTAITPQIELVVQAGGVLLPVRADATQIGQVLLNLGTNAIYALEGRPGRIEYRVENLSNDDARVPRELSKACQAAGVDVVSVSVSDSGCGMTEGTLKRMYEPFFTTKVVGQGTGLGLPVVLGIVQAHDGVIEVDSRLGEGTQFRLYFPAMEALGAMSGVQRDKVGTPPASLDGTMPLDLPVSSGSALSSATPNPPSVQQEKSAMAETPSALARHILYLDDDDTLVFLVRRLLERRGHRVTAFTDQREAIEAVRQQPDAFHLMLTDYNMPGMSGLDVAREVLALSPALPVAVASGYITDELQAEALAAGVREVVFKTDAVESFCEVVARLAG
ncbi:PAS domain S-box-containing protein [Hydrogenophaga palleronii]|uniref:histidine kinase n=1 Tax=Hydrogenophaga palleronii TaxID=65655 RepID=A0ABU1WN41_9BURK|nr:ATP-binding protein [Hydrogenophaga palleronii]MDR7150715.1 PAS domain S-box-containing protein [Hydrogenophaga palleronii]